MLTNKTIVPAEDQAIPLLILARALEAHPDSSFELLSPDGTHIPVPESLAQVMLTATQAMAHKNAVTVVIRNTWLTTQEAAELMGYSRQVVVELINKNKLKASKLGTHRRIKLSDLMDYIEQEDKQRDKAMAKLIEHTAEIGGYDEEDRYYESGKAS